MEEEAQCSNAVMAFPPPDYPAEHRNEDSGYMSESKRAWGSPLAGGHSYAASSSGAERANNPRMHRRGDDIISEPPEILLDSTTRAGDSWQEICDRLKRHDDERVKHYQEEMDSLLILAGLLSAVVTTFLVASYPLLQQDPTATTNDLLERISNQLNSAQNAALNSSASATLAPSSAPFSVSRTAIWINILWFSSLILSLFIAVFGILTKQWLRDFVAYANLPSSKETARLRQLRHDGIVGWRMFELIRALPIILQSAVIVFLAGLLIFAQSLHVLVFAVVSGLTLTGFALLLTSAILPTITADCPYRSPVAWSFLQLWQAINLICCRIYQVIGSASGGHTLPSTFPLASHWKRAVTSPNAEGWLAPDLKRVKPEPGADSVYSTLQYTDIPVLVSVCRTFPQDPVISAVYHYLSETIKYQTQDTSLVLSVLARTLGYRDDQLLLLALAWSERDVCERYDARVLPVTARVQEFDLTIDLAVRRLFVADVMSIDRSPYERMALQNLLQHMSFCCSAGDAVVNGKYALLLFRLRDYGRLFAWCYHSSVKLKKRDAEMIAVAAIQSFSDNLGGEFLLLSSVTLHVYAQNWSNQSDLNACSRMRHLAELMALYVSRSDNLSALSALPVQKGWLLPMAVFAYQHEDNHTWIKPFITKYAEGLDGGALPASGPVPPLSAAARLLPHHARQLTLGELLDLPSLADNPTGKSNDQLHPHSAEVSEVI